MTDAQREAARREAEALAERLVEVKVGVPAVPGIEPVLTPAGTPALAPVAAAWVELAGQVVFSAPLPAGEHEGNDLARKGTEAVGRLLRRALPAALLAAYAEVLAILPDARQDNEAYRRGYEDGAAAMRLRAALELLGRMAEGDGGPPGSPTYHEALRRAAGHVTALPAVGGD
jgi:hypothetical protein